MYRNTAGFTLLELLVAMLLMSLVLVGAVGSFSTHNRMAVQQDLAVSTEENLRVAMDTLMDSLRNGAYGVPTANLSSWVPWVNGFTSNPKVFSTSPFTLSVAVCSAQPVATFSAHEDSGATTIAVSSAVAGSQLSALLDTDKKCLIQINDSESALVKSVSSGSIQIDTAPLTKGNQGLKRGYPQGTPICRVEVRTFTIQTDTTTGMPWLGMDLNQGGGVQSVADGISSIVVKTVAPGKQYRISLAARSQTIDPVTGTYVTRSLSSNVTIKN
jgi:prepilin-type N-terminal cleavage/methylation domain-containing protein